MERLCSSDGLTDDLLREIERVVFDAHPVEKRLGAASFTELLDLKASNGRRLRAQCEQEIVQIGQRINEERSKQAGLYGLQREREMAEKSLGQDRDARNSLIAEGTRGDSGRLQGVASEIEARQRVLDAIEQERQALLGLRQQVEDFKGQRAHAELASMRQSFTRVDFSNDEWDRFLKVFAGDVDSLLGRRLSTVESEIARLNGPVIAQHDSPHVPYIEPNADLGGESLAALRLEADRLKRLIGLDAAKTEKLDRLNLRISQAEAALLKLSAHILDCEKAQARITGLNVRRKSEYARIFAAIEDEEAQLQSLYEPLEKILQDKQGALKRLEFSIKRAVDVESWVKKGEDLLDLRTAGPFRGQGALGEAAREELLGPWTSGSSDEVAEAMASFRAKYDRSLLDHSPVAKERVKEYWSWGGRIAEWLTSTDHIKLQYGIRYGGVDVEELSPGTRGIVLLLLYLSLDQEDDRPLIIDQPEENLDPKSIYDELVGQFREARIRRQIIIVTHNANLVVNTDVDQVIVASATQNSSGKLPSLRYRTGGLEDTDIRAEVCSILEGGETAFRERAARLRLLAQLSADSAVTEPA